MSIWDCDCGLAAMGCPPPGNNSIGAPLYCMGGCDCTPIGYLIIIPLLAILIIAIFVILRSYNPEWKPPHNTDEANK